MCAADIEFLPDDAPIQGAQAAVFQDVRIADCGVIFRLVWCEEEVECYLSRQTLEDLNHTTTSSADPEGLRKLASDAAPHLGRCRAKLQPFGNSNLMTLTIADFPKAVVIGTKGKAIMAYAGDIGEIRPEEPSCLTKYKVRMVRTLVEQEKKHENRYLRHIRASPSRYGPPLCSSEIRSSATSSSIWQGMAS